MYIRTVKKQRSKTSKVFFQYTLAQTFRVDGKVKQRAILYLGSDPLLENRADRATVLRLLQAKIFRRGELFDGEGPESQAPRALRELAAALYEKYRIKYGDGPSKNEASIPPAPARAEYHNIDIKGLEVADVRTFGAEHLCRQVLGKLQLHDCFLGLGMTEKQSDRALLGIAARAIFSSSEHRTAQILRDNSALQECFGIGRPVTHKQLYGVTDTLFANKEKIDAFLYDRISTLFDLEDRLVIFDISNTYFEGRKAGSKMAEHGRSKEKRGDCPLVVFTGVINAEGFIRHSRIYEGNKADTATLGDMIADLEKYSPAGVRQTIVIDAGIATEENLGSITDKGYKYVCISRKRLKDYPTDPQRPTIAQLTDRDKNKVELRIFRPKGYSDTWMYVRSEAKQAKERSMDGKLKKRFEEELGQIKNALHTKGGTKKINKVWERIGRSKERNRRVSPRYTIGLTEKDGLATALAWSVKKNKVSEDKAKGAYFIRTNIKDPDEKGLWNIYNTIREVESTFRCLKSDLNIRPVHHQKDTRVEAHIYQTILAYQLVNTIRYMLKGKGIHHDWTNVVRIMGTQTVQTLELPTDKKEIHLRKPSKPIKEAQEIYTATNCAGTQTAVKKYVVYH